MIVTVILIRIVHGFIAAASISVTSTITVLQTRESLASGHGMLLLLFFYRLYITIFSALEQTHCDLSITVQSASPP